MCTGEGKVPLYGVSSRADGSPTPSVSPDGVLGGFQDLGGPIGLLEGVMMTR